MNWRASADTLDLRKVSRILYNCFRRLAFSSIASAPYMNPRSLKIPAALKARSSIFCAALLTALSVLPLHAHAQNNSTKYPAGVSNDAIREEIGLSPAQIG